MRQGGTLQPGRWGVGGVVGHVQQVCLRASAVRPSNTSLHSSLTLGDVSPTLAKALSAAASSCAHCDNTQLVNLGNDCVLPCAFPAALGGARSSQATTSCDQQTLPRRAHHTVKGASNRRNHATQASPDAENSRRGRQKGHGLCLVPEQCQAGRRRSRQGTLPTACTSADCSPAVTHTRIKRTPTCPPALSFAPACFANLLCVHRWYHSTTASPVTKRTSFPQSLLTATHQEHMSSVPWHGLQIQHCERPLLAIALFWVCIVTADVPPYQARSLTRVSLHLAPIMRLRGVLSPDH